MARATMFIAGLCLTVAACNRAPPPAELSGLWSAGPASCDAGVGIRFGADAIQMVHEEAGETVFERPRYQVLSRAEPFRVRIVYELPYIPGAVHDAGARGVLVLAQQDGDGLAPEGHNLIDARTGAARARISADPTAKLLTLVRCNGHPWRAGLRGLSSG